MHERSQHRGNIPRRKPSVNLNDTRRESLGEWFYSHRIGVLVVIARYNVE